MIKRLVPGARTALVTRKAAAELIEGSPAVDALYVAPGAGEGLGLSATFRLAREIRRGGWDTALGFDHKARSGILSLLAGQRTRLSSPVPGYEPPTWPWKTVAVTEGTVGDAGAGPDSGRGPERGGGSGGMGAGRGPEEKGASGARAAGRGREGEGASGAGAGGRGREGEGASGGSAGTLPPGLVHMAEHQARLCAAALGTDYRDGPGRLMRPELPAPSRQAEEEAFRLLSEIPGDGPLAGLCLSGRQPEKSWHLLNWKAVCEGLHRSRGACFCVTGGPGDGAAARTLMAMTEAPMADFTGRTTLGGFRALCGMLDLYLSVDTGSAHLAALAGTPLMVVYTASSPALWTPMADRIRLLCYNWGLKRHGLPLEPPPGAAPWEACGIPGPAEALAAAESLLDGGRGGPGR
jgi:ADP-heptose:LPS heptosyltransferase